MNTRNKGRAHRSNNHTDGFFRLAMPRYCTIEPRSVSEAPDATLCMIRREDRSKRKKLTRRVQYNVLLSSNFMAAHRLKPLPATPVSGRRMLGEPLSWAFVALRNASFSADRIIEVSLCANEVHLLALQFFQLGGILSM
jgi:hypothetical protein